VNSRKLILIVFFGIAHLLCNGQDCFQLKNETTANRNELIATSSEKLSSRSARAIDEAEETLKKDLLVKLSEKILIQVESGSVNFVEDDGNAITQLFSSETKINSHSKLGNLIFDYCFDKKHKTLFGQCILNKTGLAESIAKECTTRLIALNAEITGFVRSGNSINVRPLERKYEAITRDFQTALFLNYEIPIQEWSTYVAQYNSAIAAIANSDEHIDLKESLEQVDHLMGQDEYEEAIALLKNMRKRHSQNDDVKHALDECFDRYLASVRLQASRLVQQHDYPAALELVDNYCITATCSKEAKELREELRRVYFSEASEMLAASMRAKEDAQAAVHFGAISKLADIKPDRYKELSARYQQFKIDRLIEKARIENDKRNYWEAYSLLRTTEMTYGIESGELKSLKESIFRKIVAQEIREEKKSRPHLNSFEFGPEAISNEWQTDRLDTFPISSMHLGIGACLYFKYNMGEVNERRGYPIASDIIGVKVRYVDIRNDFNFNSSENERTASGNKHLAECGLDGAFLHIFHYNISAVYNESSKIGSPMGMSTSFGIRIPINYVSLGVDGRYFNKFNDYTSLNMAAYVHAKFDFNRQFTRADKRKVRARVKDY
jgi:uncharacterized protein YoaH (UPF0181 family)